MSRKLQFKRGLKAKLPLLAAGEPALVTDEKELYYGTGAENIPLAKKSHSHIKSEITDFPSTMPPTAHSASHKTGGEDALVPSDFGAAETPKMVTVSLPTVGWVLTAGSYEQTVAVAGILATDTPSTCRIEPVGNTDAAAQLLTDEAYGLCFTAGGYAACNTPGQLYCRCPKGGAKPAVNFNINVCMGR